ncbi:MAG TPA: glycosyltransferase family 4 protein [Vicinamibacterales bacterium]|nr:glycosyltransferase family 4 protein [Vicinamibacterales bacterium]
MRAVILARAVFPLHGYGGLERHVFDLIRALIERGVGVTLISPPPRDAGLTAAAVHPDLNADFVPYRTFPLAGRRGTTVIDRSTAYPVWGLRAGRRALELVRGGAADIVHGFGASVLGYARARKNGQGRAPLVMNPQGLEEFGATDPSRARLKRAAYLPLRRAVIASAAAADAVIATDRSLEPVVLKHLGIPRERMTTIPNALDLRTIDAAADATAIARLRADHGVRPEERVLLSVGRLEASKGFHVLLRALAAARDHGGLEGLAWRWVALGDGPHRAALERLAAELGVQRQVRFLGRVSDTDMHAWHEVSTLFVHPTLYEGSSLVTLEAMAHRRAVVASAAGGIPDKVRPGGNGWLVPPGDPSALAAAISGAIADPARLARYGAAGRMIVEREFSWTAAGDATVALYRRLLG